LRLVEETAFGAPDRGTSARVMRSSHPPVHSAFDRIILIGLAALEVGYLTGLVRFARWALRALVGV
jgi:hypothetical protein